MAVKSSNYELFHNNSNYYYVNSFSLLFINLFPNMKYDNKLCKLLSFFYFAFAFYVLSSIFLNQSLLLSVPFYFSLSASCC